MSEAEIKRLEAAIDAAMRVIDTQKSIARKQRDMPTVNLLAMIESAIVDAMNGEPT